MIKSLRLIYGSLHLIGCALVLLILSGCSAIEVKEEELREIRSNKEYEDLLKVVPAATPTPTPVPKNEEKSEKAVKKDSPKTKKTKTKKDSSKKVVKKDSPKTKKTKTKKDNSKKVESKKVIKPKAEKTKVSKRNPEYEDTEGFDGRRPIVDPYRVGEKIKLEVSYFGVTAGYLTIETLPFKVVNGRKSYHFKISVRSSSTFSMFYSVDDYAETFIDYEKLIPYNYVIRMDETKKVGENKALFDWEKGKAYTWERKIDKKKGRQEKNYEWDLLPYSQNVFSAPFYMRSFALKPKKSLKVMVGHRGKNLEMTAKVLRREKLKTKVGTFDTVVIKPSFMIDGDFKPVGDIVFWHTDDDQKLIVRMEAKIKIGTIVGSLESLDRGQK